LNWRQHQGQQNQDPAVDEAAKYSWIKAPRWRGHAVEVGPLSRYILAYIHASSGQQIRQRVKQQVDVLGGWSTAAIPKALGLPETQYTPSNCCPPPLAAPWRAAWKASTRARCCWTTGTELVANIKAGDSATANVEKWDPATWPKEAKGVGTVAAPRGMLAHWIKIKDGRIENYQCVVPTTWNGSPRDAKGQIGAFEASLMGTPMVNPEQPLEILRTLHSFDPCLACSTHVMSPDGQEMAKVTVR
jgi:hydrogenase large subunit